ncbi:hypothetical protein LO763_26650 [Glycomyces sp. A-F 0318]|uniref:hypothetical protein n=1 Tax=Glycomyces amatae TaxID=2881355 RepID=UPI001E5F9A5D|nr:hypothetical protein [Glycomyces amatae]MCD0447200.1 hypothetical protein [Glycomyces amatae]
MLRTLGTISLVIGPLLMAVSTFLWDGERYGVTAGVVIMLANMLWVYGLIGVWERVAAVKPVTGAIGIVLSLLGCLGGIAFGLQGFFEGIFAVSGQESLDAAALYPVASAIVLWVPGPLMPISLAALGIDLAWSRLAPLWLGALLVASAAAFPLSRITRTEAIAHLADALILIAFIALAVRYLRGGLDAAPKPREPVATPQPA